MHVCFKLMYGRTVINVTWDNKTTEVLLIINLIIIFQTYCYALNIPQTFFFRMYIFFSSPIYITFYFHTVLLFCLPDFSVNIILCYTITSLIFFNLYILYYFLASNFISYIFFYLFGLCVSCFFLLMVNSVVSVIVILKCLYIPLISFDVLLIQIFLYLHSKYNSCCTILSMFVLVLTSSIFHNLLILLFICLFLQFAKYF